MPGEIIVSDMVTVLSKLANAAEDRRTEIWQYEDDFVEIDDEADADALVLEAFLAFGGSEAIQSMNNFSVAEFVEIWDQMSQFVQTNWNVGHGKQCRVKHKDVLFMNLTVLQYGGQWDLLS